MQDPQAIALFNKFIERSTLEFTNKLKSQRVQTLERLRAEKEAELEAARAQEEAARAEAAIEEPALKSVTAQREPATPSRVPDEPEPQRPQTSMELEQEVAAIDLATSVAAVNEQEGARLDYDLQQE